MRKIQLESGIVFFADITAYGYITEGIKESSSMERIEFDEKSELESEIPYTVRVDGLWDAIVYEPHEVQPLLSKLMRNGFGQLVVTHGDCKVNACELSTLDEDDIPFPFKSPKLDDVIVTLQKCRRDVLADKTFGDSEIYWIDEWGNTYATGYTGPDEVDFGVCDMIDPEAIPPAVFRDLIGMGIPGTITLNMSSDDD